MKKIVGFMFFIFLSLFLRAQDSELEINYIAHDHFNEAILNKVDDIYNASAYSDTRKTYLYLANANDPIILKCDQEHQKEYEDFRYTINSQLKHNVWPEVDVQRILKLLKEDDFIDDNGEPRYRTFTLNFYVTPSFLSYNYSETLIARLFWVLELSSQNNCVVNMYLPEIERTKSGEEHVFGPKKLNGNYKVYMYTY